MIFSLITSKMLMNKMTFGLQADRKKWLILLEVFVQVMLIGRFIVASFEVGDKTETTSFIVICSILLLLTELLPFAFLVRIMVNRLSVLNKSLKPADSIPPMDKSSSIETDDSLLDFGIDDITYNSE